MKGGVYAIRDHKLFLFHKIIVIKHGIQSYILNNVEVHAAYEKVTYKSKFCTYGIQVMFFTRGIFSKPTVKKVRLYL